LGEHGPPHTQALLLLLAEMTQARRPKSSGGSAPALSGSDQETVVIETPMMPLESARTASRKRLAGRTADNHVASTWTNAIPP
jgi:hypothetical protein